MEVERNNLDGDEVALRRYATEARERACALETARRNAKRHQTRLKTLSDVLRLLVSERPAEQILRDAAEVLRGGFPFARVSYVTLDFHDRIEYREVVGQWDAPSPKGRQLDFFDAPEALRILRTPPAVGWSWERVYEDATPSCLRALRLHPALVCRDIRQDARLAPVAERCAAFGAQAFAMLALHHSETTTGCLEIAAPHPHDWDDADVAVLQEAGEMLAVALWDAYSRPERFRGDAQSADDNETRFRRLFEADILALMTLDARRRILDVNNAFLRLVGYACEEFLSGAGDWLAANAPDALSESEEDMEFEKEIQRRDGDRLPIRIGSARLEGWKSAPIGYAFDLSERKRDEACLRDAELRMRETLEETPEPALLFSAESGILLDANAAASELYGFTRHEMIGLSLETLSLDAPREMKTLRESHIETEETESIRFETEHRRKDGSDVVVDVHASVIIYGGRRAIMSINRDITHYKRMEDALRRIRNAYFSVMRTSPLAIVALDGEGIVRDWNPAAERLLGWTEEETVGNPSPLEFEPSREASSLEADILQGAAFSDAPARCRRKDDSFLSVSVSAAPYQDELGQLQGVIVVLDDLRRNLAEPAPAAGETALRSLLENLPDIVARYDSDLRAIYAGPSLADVIGIEPGEALGKTPTEALPPASGAAAFEAALRRVFETGAAQEVEFSLNTLVGERSFHARIAPEISKGRVETALAIARDITSLRMAERERLAAERKLLEAQKLESLGVMAGGIAHDFNNLLQVMLGNAELAQLELTPGTPACAAVQKIEVATQRAMDLTEQMLAYSGKGRFVVQRVNLNAVVGGVAGEMGEEFRSRKNAAIRRRLLSEPLFIDADASQIRRLTANLLQNALEAIGEEKGVVSVSTGVMRADRALLDSAVVSSDLPEGEYVYLEIADTGVGMTREMLARIFEPFYTTKFTGRGMGLAAARGIARSHRAAVTAETEPGRGSTFRVLFPPASDFPMNASFAPAEEFEGWRGEGTALVIDDDEAARATTARMLSRLGFATLEAADGYTGVEAFTERGDEITLVAAALTMNLMGGDETARQLHRVRPECPILLMRSPAALTSPPPVPDKERGGKRSSDAAAGRGKRGSRAAESERTPEKDARTDFITKPFTLEELSEKLQTLFAAP